MSKRHLTRWVLLALVVLAVVSCQCESSSRRESSGSDDSGEGCGYSGDGCSIDFSDPACADGGHRPSDGGACLSRSESCCSDDECCSGRCGSDDLLLFARECACSEAGDQCEFGSDCCPGAGRCLNNRCTCNSINTACTSNGDCCGSGDPDGPNVTCQSGRCVARILGSGGTGGTAGAGGISATGGSEGGVDACALVDAAALSACDTCLLSHCCQQWLDCTDLACAGNTTSSGEWACLKACADQTLQMNGFVDEQSVDDCRGQCAQADSGVAATTDALLSCMLSRDGGPIDGATSCAAECLHISSGMTPSLDASPEASLLDASSDGAADGSDSSAASTDSGAACVTDAQCN